MLKIFSENFLAKFFWEDDEKSEIFRKVSIDTFGVFSIFYFLEKII